MSPTRLASLFVAVAGLAVTTAHAEPLGTGFTYQGELQDAGVPATGVFDFEFAAYTQLDGGTAVQTLCADDVTVTNGRFTVLLDFGSLPTSRVYLGLRVRPGTGVVCGNPSGFIALLPRQEITPAPFATYANRSGAADTLNGQPASFYTNANNLSAGTISTARLSPTVARTDTAQTFTGAVTFNNTANIFSGSGAGLLALNASNLTSGTVADARLSPNIPRLNVANMWSGASNSFMGDVRVEGAEAGAIFSRAPGSVNAWKISTQSNAGAASDDLQFLRYRSAGFGGISMVIKNDTGRIGMGTNFPGTKLAIAGSDASGPGYDAAISITNTAPSGGFWSMNALANPNPGLVEPGSMAMYNGSGLYAMLTQTGKLGLNGVFNPQATLDVNGMIYTRSGGIKFPDGSVQLTAVGPTPSPGPINGVTEMGFSQTWIVPSGVTRVMYEMWGAGGGGANASSGGGGGGGGAYRRGVLQVAPGQPLTIVIGQGGAGLPFGTQGAGVDGGLTSITVPGGVSIAADSGKGGSAANANGISLGGRGGGSGSGPTSIGRAGLPGRDNNIQYGFGGSGGEPQVISGGLPRVQVNVSDSYYTYLGSGGPGSVSGAGGSTAGRPGYVILSW